MVIIIPLENNDGVCRVGILLLINVLFKNNAINALFCLKFVKNKILKFGTFKAYQYEC